MRNAITWFDIPTSDFDRAVRFYSDILGAPLRVEEAMGQRLGFFPAEPQGGVGGNLVSPDEHHKPSQNGARVYLSTNDIDTVLGRVRHAGGNVLTPKFFLENGGWIAIIADSEGNLIGIQSRG